MVCYEILTGEAPFEDLSNVEVRRRVPLRERPSLPSHCPVALASYIERCWHADPEQRPTFTQICTMFRYFKACIFLGDHDRDQNAAECNDWLLHPLPTSMCARIDDMLQSSLVRQLGGLLRPRPLIIPLEMFYCRVVLQQIRYENDTTDGFKSPRRRDGSHELVAEEQSSSQQARDEIDFHESMAEGGSSSMLLDDPRWPRKGYLNKVLKWVKGLPWAWHGKSSEILQQRAAEDQSSSHQSRDEMDLVDSCNSSGSSDDFHESVAEGESISMSLDDPRRSGKGYFDRALKWVKKVSCEWDGKSSELLPQHEELQSSLGLVGDFSYKELCRATGNFSDTIGSGGFSKVYRGQLMNGQSSSHQSRDEMDLVDSFNSSGSSDDFHESVAEGESISMSLDDPRRSGKSYFDRALKWVKKVSCERDGKSSELLPQHAELRSSLGLVGDFSYKELCRATGSFSDTIGSGGFSKVYRGQLMNGQSIAVKVYEAGWKFAKVTIQGLRTASQLQHGNIVPLLGCCLQEQKNLLLVYEYMPNGDLGKHIFSQAGERVFGTWQQRYKIMGQVAAAIKYLHQDSGNRQIVHGDVKTSNIMLDSEWNARLGDCGLAIMLEEGHSLTDIAVAGTMGLLDPDYRCQGTLKPAFDVYSLGMMVLEITTGRRAYSPMPDEQDNHVLREWVWELYQNGSEVLRAADVRLTGNFDESEMRRSLVLGLACTNRDPQARPTIEDVLRILSMASDPPPPQDWSVRL